MAGKKKEDTVTEISEQEIEELEEAKTVSNKKQATAEIDPDERVSQLSSRFAREVAKASKKAKSEMYRSEHVITEFGDEEIETDSTKLREDYLELVASSKSNRRLEGKIVGFRYAGERQKSTVLAEVEYGTGLFMVLIPAYLVYDYDVSKYIEPDQLKIVENNILRRIGSRIKFVVRHVDEKEQVAYADHLEAQQQLCYENYIRPTRDGKPRIVDDLIVKAQVVYTVSKGIIVDALGCEILVPKTELSHSYVGDARQEFKVGDSVNVRVSKIKKKEVEKNNSRYTLIEAEGSVKAATPDHRKLLFDQFKEDGIYAADVSYVEESGVFCRLRGGLDCLCAHPKYGDMPKRGKPVMIRVTEKDEERLYIYGLIINS